MTTAAVPHEVPVNSPSAGPDASDPDFLRRWSEWTARGRAHDRRVRRRAQVAAIIAGTLALATLVGYVLFA